MKSTEIVKSENLPLNVIQLDVTDNVSITEASGTSALAQVESSSWGSIFRHLATWLIRYLERVDDEGVQILENLANIRVPVIAAIEGHANVHSEYAFS